MKCRARYAKHFYVLWQLSLIRVLPADESFYVIVYTIFIEKEFLFVHLSKNRFCHTMSDSHVMKDVD